MSIETSQTTPPIIPAAETRSPREALAGLLSKLAGLKGQAMPAFRLSLIEQSRDGLQLDDLPWRDQCIEMWMAAFPKGQWRQTEVNKLAPGDFPLLWVATDYALAYLVKGRLSHGACRVETLDGKTLELQASDLKGGYWLAFEVSEAVSSMGDSAPKSASDWFAFALRKHRRVFIEGVFATFIISSLALFSALYTMQVYDRVVPTRGFSTLWVLTVGVMVAILLEFIMKQARSYIVERASKRIDLELSDVFFSKAMDIRMDVRPATVGTFASQIRNFESVRSFMTASTLFILADAPFALFFIGVIAIIGGPVALVPLVMVPIAVMTGFLASRKIKEYTRLQMTESNQKNGLLIESIDGIESIKAAGGTWKMQDRYRQLTQTLSANELRLKLLSMRSTNLSQSIQQINYVGMIAVGAYAISNGQLSMGGLIACSIIAGRALSPISQIPQLVSQWNNAKIALEALDNIMQVPSDREVDAKLIIPEACEGRVRLEKVSFGYTQERPTFASSALLIKPGERVAVIGSVGSGKSTLIKLLSGLYKPQAGSVYLDDIDMQHLAPAFLREHIGYLPQDVRLFNGSLKANLTLGLPTPSDSRILQAAALTGLDQVIQNHPQGLELEITEGGRGLSGGQRQLVGLTRLLLAQPKVMLLDEPTASMDSRLEAKVMKHLFQEISPQSILVVVTHKPAVLPHVDRIIVVDSGQIVMDDTRDKVLALMRQPVKAPTTGTAPH